MGSRSRRQKRAMLNSSTVRRVYKMLCNCHCIPVMLLYMYNEWAKGKHIERPMSVVAPCAAALKVSAI